MMDLLEMRRLITETEINDYNDFDYVVKNEGFESLKTQAKEIIKKEEM